MTRHRRGTGGWPAMALGLAAVLAVLALAGPAVPGADAIPDIPDVAGVELGSGSVGAVAGPNGSLTVGGADARFMDRIYGSQNDEVVYCGRVSDGRLSVRLTEMVARGDDFAEFDSAACFDGGAGAVANVHTHPGGATRLSATDRELLTERDYRYVCVQHGPIAPDGAVAPPGLTCHTERDGEIVAVAVRPAAGSAGG